MTSESVIGTDEAHCFATLSGKANTTGEPAGSPVLSTQLWPIERSTLQSRLPCGRLSYGLSTDYIRSIQSDFPHALLDSNQAYQLSKANAEKVLEELREQRQPLVITQDGEAKAVIQDVASYEETQEILALLKILAIGNLQVVHGKTKPLSKVVSRLYKCPL